MLLTSSRNCKVGLIKTLVERRLQLDANHIDAHIRSPKCDAIRIHAGSRWVRKDIRRTSRKKRKTMIVALCCSENNRGSDISDLSP